MVAYSGSRYAGWQWQPQLPSVDNTLRTTFKKVFQQDCFYLVGASRTDAGVHAEGQVVRIKTPLNGISCQKMVEVFNKALPQDVLIKSIEEVDSTFHPQHNIAYKIYEYVIFTERPHPHIAHMGWYVPMPFQENRLRQALSFFVGTHDFRLFCKEEESKNTIRSVLSIDVEYNSDKKTYHIQVKGRSFLRYMVRRIVGSAVALALTKNAQIPINHGTIFKQKYTKILLTAPAQGLCLIHIEYNAIKGTDKHNGELNHV